MRKEEGRAGEAEDASSPALSDLWELAPLITMTTSAGVTVSVAVTVWGGGEVPLLDWLKGAECLHCYPQPRVPGAGADLTLPHAQPSTWAHRQEEAGGNVFSTHPEVGGAWFWPWVTPLALNKGGSLLARCHSWQEVSCSLTFILIQPSKT